MSLRFPFARTDPESVQSQYTKCWSVHLLLQLYEQSFLFPDDQITTANGWQWYLLIPCHSWTLKLLAVALLLFPNNSKLFAVTILLRNLARFLRCPFVWDSEFWLAFTDASVMVSLVLDNSPLLAQQWVQKQLAVFYASAAFFKLNTSFLNHRSSCAPIFALSLTERLGLLPYIPAQLLATTAPLAVVLLEAVIGLLLWLDPEKGVIVALVFHALIAVTPFPNGVPTFSCAAASRLFLVVATESEQRLEWTVPIAAILIGLGYDSAVVVFFGFAAGCLVTMRRHRNTPTSLKSKHASTVLVGLALVYAFTLPILGLQEIGSNTMFANMRLHGGSNHIIGVPTGILQQFFYDRTSPLFLKEFSGGVVRIEFTTSDYINALYPGEITSWLSEASKTKLREVGHVARQFNPKARRVLGPHIRAAMPKNGDPEFVKYTVPAFELRRIMMQAKEHARRTNTTFDLIYTKLEGSGGDEVWRKQSTGIKVELSGCDGRGNGLCRTGSGEVCDSLELVNLPPPPKLLSKLLLFYPYAIVSTEIDELVCNY